MDGTAARFDTIGNLDDLYTELDGMEMTAGWIDREKPILWPEPKSSYVPAHWRYSECHSALDAAGRLINTELAERRNLIMRNPAQVTDIATSNTLVCAYQMILPGEKARSHRHAPHALRVILDSRGSYSTVNGVKTPMETGDVVLTPGWHWHGHGHDGDEPAYWFDGLDVPLTHLLEPMFFEDHPDGFEEVEHVTEESPMRFSADSIRRGLDSATVDPEGHFAPHIVLDAPTMPTMGLHVHRMESGSKTRAFREVANSVFVVMEGSGTSRIDGKEIEWSFGDTFVAPCWTAIEHEASEDAMVFSMSDRPLMQFANYYRMEAAD